MRLTKTESLSLFAVAGAVLGAAYSFSGAGQLASAQTARPATLFQGARVIVGDGSAPIENAAFLVEGNRITSVGRAGQVQAPAGAARVDLTGKTVMPAFVDLHSHIGYEDTARGIEDEKFFSRANVIDHLERYAYTGHALTHSLGNDNPGLFDVRYADDPAKFVDLRVESQQDSFTGARYLTIGRGLAWEGTGNPRSSTPYPIFQPLQAQTGHSGTARAGDQVCQALAGRPGRIPDSRREGPVRPFSGELQSRHRRGPQTGHEDDRPRENPRRHEGHDPRRTRRPDPPDPGRSR